MFVLVFTEGSVLLHHTVNTSSLNLIISMVFKDIMTPEPVFEHQAHMQTNGQVFRHLDHSPDT